MNNMHEFIDRYVAVWNEPDAERRRERIAELRVEDGIHLTNSLEVCGYEALATRITNAYERFVHAGGFIFITSMNNADSHHNVVKFNWVMTPAACGEVAAVGFDFFILDDDGRIRCDYQFTEALPVS